MAGRPGPVRRLSFPIDEIYVDEDKRTAVARFDSHNVIKGGAPDDNTCVTELILPLSLARDRIGLLGSGARAGYRAPHGGLRFGVLFSPTPGA
jgi:hypothetical protein